MDALAIQELNLLDVQEVLQYKGYSVRLLHEFGQKTPYMDYGKIAELWESFRVHDVLFTDEIKGDLEAFIDIMMNPRSVWLEIFSLESNTPIGVANLSRVIPGFDASGHFAYWTGSSRVREDLIKIVMKWVFDRYKLHRISAEVPEYQKGVIRFINRIGFKKEGTRREGTIRHGSWRDLDMFGILSSELEL